MGQSSLVQETALTSYGGVGNNKLLNSVVWYRKLLNEEPSPTQEAMQTIADKAIEKYGKPIIERKDDDMSYSKLKIEDGEGSYALFDGTKIILCWSNCKEEGSTITVYQDENSPGFALAITPANLRGVIKNGVYSRNNFYSSAVIVEQVMTDYPPIIKEYQAYQEQKAAKEKAAEEAKQAASQQAAGKVEF